MERDDASIDTPLPSRGLLSFYDRLRERIANAEAGRGKVSKAALEALLFVPDIFILLARLTLDRDVPPASRKLIGGALIYFVLPVDLLPEAFVGIGGYLDDLLIACAVLNEAFGKDLDAWSSRYWNGSARLGRVLGDVSNTTGSLLGSDLQARIRKFLGRRGVRLDPDQTLSRQ